MDYAERSPAHRRRLLAVLSEIAADVLALEMLTRATHPLAPDIAQTLVLDRILRDAWIARPDDHVAGIVARQLLQFLAAEQALRATPDGLSLELAAAADGLQRERARLKRLYRTDATSIDAAIGAYLARYGWVIERSSLALAAPDPLIERLGRCVRPEAAAAAS